MFRLVLIEIELDLFVDYKTSFSFVLPTDVGNIITQISFALLDSHHRDINQRFLSNLRVNVFLWVLIEIELDLCGSCIKVERKL